MHDDTLTRDKIRDAAFTLDLIKSAVGRAARLYRCLVQTKLEDAGLTSPDSLDKWNDGDIVTFDPLGRVTVSWRRYDKDTIVRKGVSVFTAEMLQDDTFATEVERLAQAEFDLVDRMEKRRRMIRQHLSIKQKEVADACFQPT